MNTKNKCSCTEDELCYDHQLPDAEATVEQVKNASKYLTRKEYISFLSKILAEGTDKNGYKFLFDNTNIKMDSDKKEILVQGIVGTNHWKYACISILLGLVVAIILSNPFIIKAIDICIQ